MIQQLLKAFESQIVDAVREDSPDRRHLKISVLIKDAHNDAEQVTIGRVVTFLWGIARKTEDAVEKSRIKNLAAQIASMEL